MLHLPPLESQRVPNQGTSPPGVSGNDEIYPQQREGESSSSIAASIRADMQDSMRNRQVPKREYDRKVHINATVSSKSASSFPTTLANARAKLQEYMASLDMHMFSTQFSDLVNMVEDCDPTPDFIGNTQLVLIDPPYNVRSEARKPNSEYDLLFADDMDKVLQTIDAFLRPGGHCIIFCSAQQFPIWLSKIQTYSLRQSQVGADVSEGSGRTFTVDSVPMVLVNKVNANKSFPGRSSCALQSNAEFAVHLKRNGLAYSSEHAMVNYRPFGYISSSFSATKNTIDNIPLLSPNEGLFWPREDGKKRKGLVRPEQKSLQLLKELVSRFSQPGDKVVDFFAGSFSTAVACFSLPGTRKFVGCEKDNECFKLAQPFVQDRFAQCMTNPNHITDIVLPDDILECASRLALTSKYEEVSSSDWKAPAGFPQYLPFPVHIFNHFTSCILSHEFFRQYYGAELSSWPIGMQQRFNSLDVLQLLQAEQAAFSVAVLPSLIKHKSAGLGLFAGKPFDQGDIVCYYYGTMVYHDLGKRKSKNERYGGVQIMNATVERFNRYAVNVRTTGTVFNEVGTNSDGMRSVYVVPPEFCAGAYVNDYRYQKDDEDYAKYVDPKIALPDQRTPNVKIAQEVCPISSINPLKKADFLTIQAIKRINIGEELYMDYDRPYILKD